MRLLITGASGFAGSQLGLHWQEKHDLLGLIHSAEKLLPFPSARVDLRRAGDCIPILDDFKPEVIIHTAALSRVLDCEDDPENARRINVEATARLSEWSVRHSCRLIFFSSDQVFRGDAGPYRETDTPSPVNEYGRNKAEAEQFVLRASESNLVLRSNSIVGPTKGWGASFTDRMLVPLSSGEQVQAFTDQYRSPIHIRMMVKLVDLAMQKQVTGILHAGGPQAQSRYETLADLVKACKLNPDLLIASSYKEHPRAPAMHADGTFDISHLNTILPELDWRPLLDEFRDDAARSAHETSH